MDRILIEGGYKLRGRVRVSGSKNSALPILIASLLTDGECVIENVPELRDIDAATAMLGHLGKKVARQGHVVRIRSKRRGKAHYSAPYDLIRKMRASFLVAGPLLARYGRVRVPLPGGCAIGVRPVNIHLGGFEKLGADVELKKGDLVIKARKLKGARIRLPFPSVGATENILMAASVASGSTVITNAAREPEITDLAFFLNKLGAKITGAGTGSIKVSGTGELGGAVHKVIPDRIEAGTYMLAAAITRGSVSVENCMPEHLSGVVSKLRRSGVKVETSWDCIYVRPAKKLKAASISTGVYPGFPTDLQAQWMALMCTASGKSVIRESIFENRFLHVAELQRLGAGLDIKGDRVHVRGGTVFSGAPVMVSDLRAGAALVLAGLAARGRTLVRRVYHLDRGYEKLEVKLKKLGARITRLSR